MLSQNRHYKGGIVVDEVGHAAVVSVMKTPVSQTMYLTADALPSDEELLRLLGEAGLNVSVVQRVNEDKFVSIDLGKVNGQQLLQFFVRHFSSYNGAPIYWESVEHTVKI